MRTLLARFLADESGSTAIEYTLIAAGIAIAILTAVNALGGSLGGLFETLDGKIGADASGGAGG
jgi:pilus assembly protein Flp/PilA